MAQHKASNLKTLISAMSHKEAAEKLLSSIEDLKAAAAAVKAKVAIDTDGTWDTDYLATAGVSVTEFDSELIGQYRQSLRKILISKLKHKKLGNDIADIIEEVQISFNAVLAQMDVDAGTLSDDATYEAYRIANIVDPDAKIYGAQHQASMRKVLIDSVAHKELGNFLADSIASIQTSVNTIIDLVQVSNA